MLCKVESLCTDMQNAIRFEKIPLHRIVTRLWGSGCEFIDCCALHINDGDDFHTAWTYAAKTSPDLRLLGKEEQEALCLFGQSLGKSDVAGELGLIEGFRAKIIKLREESGRELATKGRMFQSCGFLGGAFFAILFI